jgi:hypothetical protein
MVLQKQTNAVQVSRVKKLLYLKAKNYITICDRNTVPTICVHITKNGSCGAQ